MGLLFALLQLGLAFNILVFVLLAPGSRLSSVLPIAQNRKIVPALGFLYYLFSVLALLVSSFYFSLPLVSTHANNQTQQTQTRDTPSSLTPAIPSLPSGRLSWQLRRC